MAIREPAAANAGSASPLHLMPSGVVAQTAITIK
jgi:hypothetical protein